MCFSASASFGAGVILSTIGVISLKQVKTSSQIPFASIPLIFAAQQISEGVLWLALPSSTNLILPTITTYIFLFFAQVVWPIWVPFSILKLEKNENKKKILRVLVGTGLMVSVVLAYCLLRYRVQASIMEYHISYQQDYPYALSHYGGVFYIIATIAPPFFSSAKKMWALGFSILISYIITTIFYDDYLVSVWCFFASVIGIAVFVIMKEMKKNTNEMIAIEYK